MRPDIVLQLRADIARWGSQVKFPDRVLKVTEIQAVTGLTGGRLRRLYRWAALGEGEEDHVQTTPRLVKQEDSEGILVSTQWEEPEDDDDLSPSKRGSQVVRNLEELAKQAEIDLSKWSDEGTFKVATWPTTLKRKSRDGDQIVVVRSWYVSARFKRRLDSLVLPTDFGKPLQRKNVKPGSSIEVAITVPDMHVGYRWSDGHQKLLPLHDWNAHDVVLQLIKEVQPNIIQNLGDGLDNAPFSDKWKVPISLRDTARPSLLTMYALLRAQRQLAPEAEINWQSGNHDERTERPFVGTEWDGLQAADRPNGPPVLSIHNLLGLEGLDIRWQNYGDYRWLWDSILIEHAPPKMSGKSGKTVSEVIRDATHSTVFGHIHRCEMASRTLHFPQGIKTISAMSCGTLGRVDGFLPGYTKRPNYQHGVGIIYWDRDKRQEHIEVLPIHDGVLFYRGMQLRGDGYALCREIASQIGYPQICEK
jgi:hypothetical protein